jgi:hypothetical protein
MFDRLSRHARIIAALTVFGLLGGVACASSQTTPASPEASTVKSGASSVAETATHFAHDVKDLAVKVGHGARDIAVDIADGTKEGVAKANSEN